MKNIATIIVILLIGFGVYYFANEYAVTRQMNEQMMEESFMDGSLEGDYQEMYKETYRQALKEIRREKLISMKCVKEF